MAPGDDWHPQKKKLRMLEAASLVEPPLVLGAKMNHLLMHVYPFAGGAWRRSVQHVVARRRLFDGRRVVSIAIDEHTESAAAVVDEFGDDPPEFSIGDNCPGIREGASLLGMLDLVSGFDGKTFYCHSKGATKTVGTLSDPWADIMFTVLCDFPGLIDCALQEKPVAGCFRRHDGSIGAPWHYSGSFYWFRNRDLFARGWRHIDHHFAAVETYPARIFSADESQCLFYDNAGDLYEHARWDSQIPAVFRQWVARLRSCGVHMTDCSTTDFSKLPETIFQPLIRTPGSDTKVREKKSWRSMLRSLLHVPRCLAR